MWSELILVGKSCGQTLHLPPTTQWSPAPSHIAPGQVDSAHWCGRNLSSSFAWLPKTVWKLIWQNNHLVTMWFLHLTQVKEERWRKGRGQAGHLGNSSPPDWPCNPQRPQPTPLLILVLEIPPWVFIPLSALTQVQLLYVCTTNQISLLREKLAFNPSHSTGLAQVRRRL